MPKYLKFLTSNRFHALLLMGLAIWAHSLGWIPAELMAFLELVLGGHIVVRSVDKLGESIGKKK